MKKTGRKVFIAEQGTQRDVSSPQEPGQNDLWGRLRLTCFLK
jgi:hypothetical protein